MIVKKQHRVSTATTDTSMEIPDGSEGTTTASSIRVDDRTKLEFEDIVVTRVNRILTHCLHYEFRHLQTRKKVQLLEKEVSELKAVVASLQSNKLYMANEKFTDSTPTPAHITSMGNTRDKLIENGEKIMSAEDNGNLVSQICDDITDNFHDGF